MKSIMPFVIVLGLVTAAGAQLDTESIPPELDQRDLYARAATSRLVVIGKVLKTEGRSERVAPDELLQRLNQGTVRGGSLITVQVEEIVCRQSDFDSTVPTAEYRPQPFYLFIPFGESDLPNGDFREILLPNQRYMLLLSDLDSSTLSSTYQLDPNPIYYRGQGHNRGVIPFEPQTLIGRAHMPPEVIDKFRMLCSAMRPPKSEDKLALLQQLAASGDPVLEKEAGIAKSAVKALMLREQQSKQPSR